MLHISFLKARETIGEFDDLLETGFKGRERDLVDNFIAELDAIEADTDQLQIKLRQDLRGIELEMKKRLWLIFPFCALLGWLLFGGEEMTRARSLGTETSFVPM